MLQIITYTYNIRQDILLVRCCVLNKKLVIKKKSLTGEDGYKVFSIRIKDETVAQLDALSKATNRSRNELINLLLEFGLENSEVE